METLTTAKPSYNATGAGPLGKPSVLWIAPKPSCSLTLSQEGICCSEQKVEDGTEPVSLQEAWSHPHCKVSPFQTL